MRQPSVVILAPVSARPGAIIYQSDRRVKARDFSRVISGNRSGHWTQSLTPPAPRAPQPARFHSRTIRCLWWINSISCPGVWYWGGIHQTAENGSAPPCNKARCGSSRSVAGALICERTAANYWNYACTTALVLAGVCAQWLPNCKQCVWETSTKMM